MKLDQMEGMHVGALTRDELDEFIRAVKEGRAYRSYEGAGGFMGLAKVRLVREPDSATHEQR